MLTVIVVLLAGIFLVLALGRQVFWVCAIGISIFVLYHVGTAANRVDAAKQTTGSHR